LYGAFVALGLYFLLANKDISATMSTFGIALVFDPFDQKVMWNNRPAYQQIWLMVHLSIVFGLLGIMLFNWLAK
jgi:H+/Cl- antiporter ClcA